jgi:branched-chain amino acid transport system ATP-binding protein
MMSATGGAILQAEDLYVGYSGVAVVSELDLEVHAGEVVALLGRNGAGKTTILSTLAGNLPAIKGTISLDGKTPPKDLHRRVRAGVGFVTEDRAIIRRLKVIENLRLGQGSPAAALELFPELDRLRTRKAGLLSGGEQQMLALGRVLAGRPKAILIDELSFGLAPLIVERLLQAVRLAAAQGAGVLLVEQHPELALKNADRAYVLAGGKVRMAGAASDILGRRSELEKVYLSG